MSKISEFRIGKGKTIASKDPEEWTKKYFELTMKMPEQFTEKDLQEAMMQAEYLVDNFLGQPETPQIPQFNPEELMKHEWKSKKTGEGTYAKGSPSWGWDFRDKFSPEVIKTLEKGPLTIEECEFTLGDNIVNAKKKKKS